MSFILVQFVCLLFFVLSLDILVRNRWINPILKTIGVLFIMMEVTSYLIGDALIDYKFYIHMSPAILIDKGGFFKKEIALLLAFGGLLYVGIGFFSRWTRSIIENYKYLVVGLLFGCLLVMSIKNGIAKNIWDIVDFGITKNKSFDEAIAQLGFEDFVKKTDLKASGGKNIVVIMLESVEKAYLMDNLAHLTPHMRSLSHEFSYYNMLPSIGSDFTTAGIYTYLTGVPLFFKNHGNDVFNYALDSRMPSITHSLNAAGYRQLYMMGNPEFAGVKTMLNFFDVEVKSEKNYDEKYTIDHWGMHDKDLFELARKEILDLDKKEGPFAFYISTISTHPPNGIFDPRMAKEVPAQKTQLEMMVAAVDKQVGDFIQFLKDEKILENTVIYIMPDHLLMGRMSEVINDFQTPRNLFVITNSTSTTYNPKKDILQIDVSKLMLEGANVKTNMSFLTDMIKGDKLDFILRNRTQLLQLNEASLVRKERPKKVTTQANILPQGHLVQLRSIAWSKEYLGLESTILLGEKNVSAKRGVNILRYDSSQYYVQNFDTFQDTLIGEKLVERLEELTLNKAYFSILVHDSAGDVLRYFKDRLKSIGFSKLSQLKNRQAYVAFSRFGYISEAIRPNKLYFNMPYVPRKSLRGIEEIEVEARDPSKFIAHAGGAIDGNTYTDCLEALNNSYKNGFRLFELDIIETSDGHYVASHDWNKWRDECNYGGDVPVSLKVFKNIKIKGKYSPMSMDDINHWFKSHPKAILVTDKVNEPRKFANQFIDKNRLMMELFTIDAAKEALEVGIKAPILTEECLKKLNGNKIEALQELGIEYLAVSRRTIDNNKELYLSYKKADIKVFAYHVNFDPLKDEAYMLREGMDYCYGFYSDYHVLK